MDCRCSAAVVQRRRWRVGKGDVLTRGGRVCSDQGRVVQWPGEGV